MTDTFGFEPRTSRRPPYELCVFRYVSKAGLEIINAMGPRAEELYDQFKARGSLTDPCSELRPRSIRRDR